MHFCKTSSSGYQYYITPRELSGKAIRKIKDIQLGTGALIGTFVFFVFASSFSVTGGFGIAGYFFPTTCLINVTNAFSFTGSLAITILSFPAAGSAITAFTVLVIKHPPSKRNLIQVAEWKPKPIDPAKITINEYLKTEKFFLEYQTVQQTDVAGVQLFSKFEAAVFALMLPNSFAIAHLRITFTDYPQAAELYCIFITDADKNITTVRYHDSSEEEDELVLAGCDKKSAIEWVVSQKESAYLEGKKLFIPSLNFLSRYNSF